MNLYEAIEQLKQIITNRIEDISDYKKYEDTIYQIREKIRKDKTVKISTINNQSNIPISISAIDSSSDVVYEDLYGKRIYTIIIQSLAYMPSFKDGSSIFNMLPEIIKMDEISLFQEEEEIKSIMSAIGLCYELLEAQELASRYKIVLMDGSVETFVIKINQAAQIAKRYPQLNISKWFLENYEKIVKSLYFLVNASYVIFIPKSSSRREFINYFHLNMNCTDFELMLWLLQNGEYITVPIEIYENYHLPPVSNFDLSQLWQKINNGVVVYLKMFHAHRIYKLELFNKGFLDDENVKNTVFNTFVLDGENFLTNIVDREAKKKLSFLKESGEMSQLWRIRI